MESQETAPLGRARWRLASAAPLPLLLVLYAVWTDLVTLDRAGLHLAWSPVDFVEWLTLALGTVLLVAAFWARSRPIRILAGAIYSLALAFGFGAAGVIAIVHAFGGRTEEPDAPGWVLVALGVTATVCALALLALAALLVDDIRAADAQEA